MAYCTHCGAKLPDGARFCTSCGKPVAAAKPQGIVIDAPPGATVTISDAPDQPASVHAPSTKGESVLASWSAPKPKKPEAPAPQQSPQFRQQPQQAQAPRQPQYPPQQPVAANGPMTVKQALKKSKDDLVPKKGKVKWWIWVLIAIGTYLLLQFFPIN